MTRIEAREGQFALKKSKMKQNQAERFFHTLRFFEKNQVPTVLPVLHTRRNEKFFYDDGFVYYLTPWGEDCRDLQKENECFKTLALFHRFTEQRETIKEEEWEKRNDQFRKNRDADVLALEAFADEIEKKRYYSPFELAFLMHFPFLYRLHKDSLYWFHKWTDAASMKGTLKMVCCHGKPSADHLVRDYKGEFKWINVEASGNGHPQHDVAHLYKSCLKENQWEPVQTYSWIQSYKENAATFDSEDEFLLKSQLLNESPMYSFLEKARRRHPSEEHIWTWQLENQMVWLEKVKETVEKWPAPKKEE
ncbi:protein kinase family protein [Alteribacillus iranensis]|uniref:Spore coat protein YsxE n=1 Tax=Alteribacillus iranensis TaxID=930128 RepID=A0A1I2CNE4_9BACI|nr:hypothetical protein [Alteribacillus iranensis]SFE69919.1 spore coat protein YsxE [Alteribacillus iranensis]